MVDNVKMYYVALRKIKSMDRVNNSDCFLLPNKLSPSYCRCQYVPEEVEVEDDEEDEEDEEGGEVEEEKEKEREQEDKEKEGGRR